MINRRTLIASTLLFPWTLILAQAAEVGGLEVSVTYTGAGPVDEKHKVYVMVWDRPDFERLDAADPIAVQSTSSKRGKVKFTGLKATPVYVGLGYDPKGEWHASAPPTLNVWLGTYRGEDGKPKRISLRSGELRTISVTLDDSFQRPPDANGK